MKRLRAPLALLLVVGCACSVSHPQPDAPVEPDGGFPDVPWMCGDPNPPRFTEGLCDEGRRAICAAWAQSLVERGVGRSTCRLGTFTGCFLGDHCIDDGGGFPPAPCDCDGAICALGQVCVSDAAGGPARCIDACSR